MSVIIRGVKMPETCDECPCHHYHSAGKYVCEATPMFYPWNLANTKGIRKDWCPLVELPAEHGRLIDADFVIAEYDKIHVGKPGGARLLIANAPTVIEAEEVQNV